MAQRIAVVTGGMGGIGEAMCIRLAKAGHKVVATYSPGNTRYSQWLQDMKGKGFEFHAVQVDVTDFDSCQKAVAKIQAEVGPIDILVNNAGITRDNIFIRMKDEEWDTVLQVNLTAVFRLSRAAVRGMMRRRSGRIIGITSIVGVTGNPGQGNYAAAKAGMIGMSKSIALEVASRGITVNCVAPGFIETAMTDALNDKQREATLGRVPAGRLGTADEIASAVVYLASDEAAYVTGQTLHVNGGMAMI